nr:MAG TPA: hypothetical protein [Caudoviricetes sp.]
MSPLDDGAVSVMRVRPSFIVYRQLIVLTFTRNLPFSVETSINFFMVIIFKIRQWQK